MGLFLSLLSSTLAVYMLCKCCSCMVAWEGLNLVQHIWVTVGESSVNVSHTQHCPVFHLGEISNFEKSNIIVLGIIEFQSFAPSTVEFSQCTPLIVLLLCFNSLVLCHQRKGEFQYLHFYAVAVKGLVHSFKARRPN